MIKGSLSRWLYGLLWAGLVGIAALPVHADSTNGAHWILIDSNERTLSVMQDEEQALQVFENIAFGRGGVAPLRRDGDGKTPIGTFHVAWINPDSQFHLFFGLDYPGQAHAEEAYRQRIIDIDTYVTIREAHHRRQLPPQDTALGGHIGIHGVGDHDVNIHRRFNWTRGCIAMTDQQVEELAPWVTLGTRVVIR